MKHSLIEQSTPEQLSAAKEAADWLLDAVATATQDKRFLRGEDVYDAVAGEAILACGAVACLRFLKSLEANQ